MRNTKMRVLPRAPIALEAAPKQNDAWTMSFMVDAALPWARDRIFNVLDEGSCEALAIEIDVWLPSERVVTVLD